MIRIRTIYFLLFMMLLTGCKEETLLNSLDQKQANEVLAVLQSHDVMATKQRVNKEGFSIQVQQKDFLNAVNLMNHYGLPSKPRVEVAQMFPDDSLVASPLAEKARLYSAIEQRLEQSLQTLTGVVSAALHISYDFDVNRQGRGKHDIHLTAIIRHAAELDAQILVADIKRFLKNSFSDVDYDNISVVMTPANKVEYLPTMAHQSTKINPVLIIFAIVILSSLLGMLAIWLFKKQIFKAKRQKNHQAVKEEQNVKA